MMYLAVRTHTSMYDGRILAGSDLGLTGVLTDGAHALGELTRIFVCQKNTLGAMRRNCSLRAS